VLAKYLAYEPKHLARQMGHRSLKMFFEVSARWIDGADKGTLKALIDAKTAAKTATKVPRKT
jgi:integrase